MPIESRINPVYTMTADQWVVSILCKSTVLTGTGEYHPVLVFEGEETDPAKIAAALAAGRSEQEARRWLWACDFVPEDTRAPRGPVAFFRNHFEKITGTPGKIRTTEPIADHASISHYHLPKHDYTVSEGDRIRTWPITAAVAIKIQRAINFEERYPPDYRYLAPLSGAFNCAAWSLHKLMSCGIYFATGWLGEIATRWLPAVTVDKIVTPNDEEILYAAAHGNVLLLQEAIRVGVSIEITGKLGSAYHHCTPLIAAARYGKEDTVRLLLDQPGVNIHAKTGYGNTALDWAETVGHDTIAGLLITRGAVRREGLSPVTVVKNANTTLMKAAIHGDCKGIRLALSLGANIDAHSSLGEYINLTPLMVAARNGYKDAVVLLLDRGADRSIKTIAGYTAESLARLYHHTDIADSLAATAAVAGAVM